ncbi:uncharacterized protein LOC122643577 [Telopea speciosissima]|uniref:uncharacterized protein LOC122643577 n=1 Tax=Telopea speciosissima TaxID=54955 RepID=UPI001CC39205|nr:uncharacterized protein LOC122643577 [Telopea speciosissima]
MRLLGWNCQGLGRPSTVRALHHLLRRDNPDVVFLRETKSKDAVIERIMRRGNFHGLVMVKPEGAAGSLALLWKENVKLSIKIAEKNFIDMEISMVDAMPFLLTCVYGDPIKHRRKLVWDRRVCALHSHQQHRWLCYGDFNSYLSWHEKDGGSQKCSKDIDIFRDFIDKCDFLDLGFHGPMYTWSNKRRGQDNIRIRLDRALCNPAWRQAFANAAIFMKPTVSCDHCPILLDTDGGRSTGRRPFRFESMWLFHNDCKNAASRAWSLPTTVPVV